MSSRPAAASSAGANNVVDGKCYDDTGRDNRRREEALVVLDPRFRLQVGAVGKHRLVTPVVDERWPGRGDPKPPAKTQWPSAGRPAERPGRLVPAAADTAYVGLSYVMRGGTSHRFCDLLLP